MFRIALTIYLTIASVLGPALCCCSLGRIISAEESSGCCAGQSELTRSAAAIKVQVGHHHHGTGHHHHGAIHDHHSHAGEDASQKGPSQSQHNDEEPCPCGRIAASHSATLIDSVQLNEVVLQNAFSAMLFVYSSFQSMDCEKDSVFADSSRPATLSGRDILRAYQIMRC